MALSGATVARVLVVISLLLGGVEGSNGVGKRVSKDRVTYYCEVSFKGSSKGSGHREKVWVGTYDAEFLAVLACDVAFYYTDMESKISNEINLQQAMLGLNCPPKSSYAMLTTWDQRTEFIKTQANAVVRAVQTDFQFGPEDAVLMHSEQIAERVAAHFPARPRGELHQLVAFMFWFLDPSKEQQLLETFLSNYQISEEAGRNAVLRLYTDHGVVAPESLDVDLDNFATHMRTLIEARSRGGQFTSIMRLLFLFGSALPVIFHGLGGASEEESLRGGASEGEKVWAKPMPAKRLQKLEHVRDVLHRMAPGLKVSEDRVPEESNMDKVEAFENQTVSIAAKFKKRWPGPGFLGQSVARNPEDEKKLVWTKLQALRELHLTDMIELYGMLTARGNQPMPAEQLQRLKHYKDVLHRMIPYLRVPQDRVPPEFNIDKVDAFEKQIVTIMQTFKRRRQAGGLN